MTDRKGMYAERRDPEANRFQGLVTEPRPWAVDGLCAQEEHREPFLLALDIGPTGLMQDGLYRPLDPEEDEGYVRALADAVSVCEECPVKAECREYALTHEEKFGVWGGLYPQERFELAQLAKRAARQSKERARAS